MLPAVLYLPQIGLHGQKDGFHYIYTPASGSLQQARLFFVLWILNVYEEYEWTYGLLLN